MTKEEVIIKVLTRTSCQTAERIAGMAMQTYQFKMTPSQVSGTMRAMVARGQAGSSKNEYGKTVYWLNKENKNDN